MQPVLSRKRPDIKGGVWTPKVGGVFQEGDPNQSFLIKGRADIKELGGHLKLFMTEVKIEMRKVYLSTEQQEAIKQEYRTEMDTYYANLVEAGNGEFPTDEARLERERKELPDRISAAQKELEEIQLLGVPKKMCVQARG
jgi:hypothetical protein